MRQGVRLGAQLWRLLLVIALAGLDRIVGQQLWQVHVGGCSGRLVCEQVKEEARDAWQAGGKE